jgi:DNA-binding response OmpR family regulator
VVRSDTIIERVWGYDARGDTGSLKAHIRHLREKVESNPSRPELIVTVPGVGYMCRLA